MSHLANKGRGAQGAQGSASAEHWFTARQTQPTGSWGQPGKRLRISVHGHFKSALHGKEHQKLNYGAGMTGTRWMFWEWILWWPTSSFVSLTDRGVREYLELKEDPDWAPAFGCQMRCPLVTHPWTCLPAPTPVLDMATTGVLVTWTWQDSQNQAGQATSNRPQVCPVPQGTLILRLAVEWAGALLSDNY